MALADLGKKRIIVVDPPPYVPPPPPPPFFEPPPFYDPPVIIVDPILIDDPVVPDPGPGPGTPGYLGPPISGGGETPESLYYLARRDAASPYGGWASSGMATALEPPVSYETAFPQPRFGAIALAGFVLFGAAMAIRSWRSGK